MFGNFSRAKKTLVNKHSIFKGSVNEIQYSSQEFKTVFFLEIRLLALFDCVLFAMGPRRTDVMNSLTKNK